MFELGQHIHVIGIGGYGMSAIARILLERGFSVSGSDRNSNDLTKALSRDGAVVYQGHSSDYVQNNVDIVLRSSAVKDDHVEVLEARSRGIPVFKRRDILASLMVGYRVIAIAGTHGKTTTTSMVTHILSECGKSPSYIVGGVLSSTGTNAGVGESDLFVIEADEYDNMFLGLKPNFAVLTSVEYDHPDFFKSENQLLESFKWFIDNLDDGLLIACGDDVHACNLAKEYDDHILYGKTQPISISNVQTIDGITRFDGGFSGVEGAVGIQLNVPGIHNVRNATAAIAVTNQVGVPVECAIDAISTFKTTGRRFDLRGEISGVIVIDDYAHHPTAVRMTLDATRSCYPNHKIWAVWQPHMFSRTQLLIEKYAKAFGASDCVVVTDIFAAREQPIDGVDGRWVASQIHHPSVNYSGTIETTTDFLVQQVEQPAIIIIMSAGDAPKIGEGFLKRRENENTSTNTG